MCSGEEHPLCGLQNEVVVGNGTKEDGCDDHDDFEDTAQVTQEVNGAVDAAFVGGLQLTELDLCLDDIELIGGFHLAKFWYMYLIVNSEVFYIVCRISQYRNPAVLRLSDVLP